MDILQLLVSGIANGCIYGLLALGFVLIYKASEAVNFAQGDMMMLGAFLGITVVFFAKSGRVSRTEEINQTSSRPI